MEPFESRVVPSDYKRWSQGIDFPIWPSHKWLNRFESRVVPSDYKMVILRDRFSYLTLTQMMESFRITSRAKWLQTVIPWDRFSYLALTQMMESFFLAQRIGISEILPWVRKSYLTHAILPRLSPEGFIHWLYWNSRTSSSSDDIVMFKWRHHVHCIFAYSGTSGSLFLNKKQRWARKILYYSCEGRREKSVPRDNRLSSLGKPSDAKRWSSGRIFLSYPHTHDRFLYSCSPFDSALLLF